MVEDITGNVEKILAKIAQTPYEQIMSQYRAKAKEYATDLELCRTHYFPVQKLDIAPTALCERLHTQIHTFLESNLTFKELSTALIKKGSGSPGFNRREQSTTAAAATRPFSDAPASQHGVVPASLQQQ
jgi:hypothetical protein